MNKYSAIWMPMPYGVKLVRTLNYRGATIEAIDRFLAVLHDVDENNGAAFFLSPVWSRVKDAAHVLVANVRN